MPDPQSTPAQHRRINDFFYRMGAVKGSVPVESLSLSTCSTIITSINRGQPRDYQMALNQAQHLNLIEKAPIVCEDNVFMKTV